MMSARFKSKFILLSPIEVAAYGEGQGFILCLRFAQLLKVRL